MPAVDEKFPWFKFENHYSVEASNLKSEPYCPVCDAELLKVRASGIWTGQTVRPPQACELVAQLDTDGDVQCWEGACKCGTNLIIFND